MATGQYPRLTSGTFIVNRQASQVIIVRPCLPPDTKNHTTGNSRRFAEEGRVNHGKTTSGKGRCYTSPTTEVDGRRPLQRRRLTENPTTLGRHAC